MDKLHIDFETRSQVDLKVAGVYNYASDLSTEVMMMGWAFNDEPAKVWLPDETFPKRIIDHIRSGAYIHAHNAQFERLIFAYVLTQDFDYIPNPDLRQWKCTAAQTRSHGLPGKLKEAARCLDLPMQKMPEGQRLLKAYSLPGHSKDISPEDLHIFIEYCRLDVEVERLLSVTLRDLTDDEWEMYWVNEEINDRGLPIDVNLTRAATKYGDVIRAEADQKIKASTKGAVFDARKRKTRDDWLSLRLTDAQKKILIEDDKVRFAKPQRKALLGCDDLDPDVREFVMAVEEAGGATISKYEAFTDRSMDGRLYGAFLYAGGGQTGRFSSVGVQVHNLKREGHKDPEKAISEVLHGSNIARPSEHLAKLIRAVISHPDGLVWADYSNIEGRVAPWLADSKAGEKKLDVFREGKDPYKVNAATLFNVRYEDVTDEQRQIGKVQELALGFLGGAGALMSMARMFKMSLEHDRAVILRDAWRKVNDWAIPYGYDLVQAARDAIENPNMWFKAGRVSYGYDGRAWLWCCLPSGRLLAYYQPSFEWVTTPWGEEINALTSIWGGGKCKVGQSWPRRPLTPGLLLENATQATAADILRTAIVNACHAGIEVVGHVHDEIIAQNTTEEELLKFVLDAPAWTAGLPIEAKPSSGIRYGK